MPDQILFLGHNAGRTGAPIVFLNFLRWFKEQDIIPFQILLREGGSLASEYQALAPVTILNQGLLGFLARRLTQFGFHSVIERVNHVILKRRYTQCGIGLIYSNTVTNGSFLDALSFLHCPVISHVHELDNWIRYRIGMKSFGLTQKHTDYYIAVSDAVKQNLIQNYHIASNQVGLIYEFVDTSLSNLIDISSSRKRICQQFNIPSNAFIVGGSGTTDWRKGPDLFILVAQSIYKYAPHIPVFFLWIGGENKGRRFLPLRHAINQSGLGERIQFLGIMPNPLDYFAAMDIFALTSREDPFPLVMLEAASLGKPILAFDVSGGAKEFIENDCGVVVPYQDVNAMSKAAVELLSDSNLRYQLGQQARHKVQTHYDLSTIAPQIAEVIKRFYQAK